MVDYKFNYIQDSFYPSAKVTFYEGNFQIVKENEKLVRRYVRTKVLDTRIVTFDWGMGRKDMENVVNKELLKYGTPIKEQSLV